MCNRFRIALIALALALAATPMLDAAAQSFPQGFQQGIPQGFPAPPAAPPCVAPKNNGQPDSRLADRIAAAQQSIDSKKAGAWTALVALAGYACGATGDRAPVDAAFQHCFRECADRRDLYFAHVFYAQALDRFGDLAGAENQYVEALQSREEDVHDAVTAYMGYATMLERHGRTRDALDVLNRFAGHWGYTSPPLMFKLSLMRALGMDTLAEEDASKRMPGTGSAQMSPEDFARMRAEDFARMRADAPALSALPVEMNALAQMPFGRTLEVVGEAWIEQAPAQGVSAPRPGHLYYHSASMPDPNAFQRSVALEAGQRLLVVADLGDRGCRVAVAGARYDIEECPWRSGRADASLFRVVEERTRVPPAFVMPRPQSPVPIGASPESEPAPLWEAWQLIYRDFAEAAKRGQRAFHEYVFENAGLTDAEEAQVLAAGKEYMRQNERIDTELRRQIAERFGPSDPRLPFPPVAADDPRPPLTVDRAKLPDGKTLQEVLTDEGVISKVDAQKDALLQAHLADIAHAIGPDKAAALERVVRERVAPGIQRTIRAAPPMPMPPAGVPLPGPRSAPNLPPPQSTPPQP